MLANTYFRHQLLVLILQALESVLKILNVYEALLVTRLVLHD